MKPIYLPHARVWMLALLVGSSMMSLWADTSQSRRPNIVLMMSDDQGWGETGYNGHPHLQTPALDEMARSGLRFNRFYAASPVCTPTRASVMTGRHANRSGAFSWNWTIRPEEITIAEIVREAGYRTAHFGKWHIGSIAKASPLSPAAQGFDEYLSHDNFFEMDSELSRNGEPPQSFKGDSSEYIVDESLKFIRRMQKDDQPFFVVIWFGSPHDPYIGSPGDVKPFLHLGAQVAHRFAEITAMDRSIGHFRKELDSLGLRQNTLLWFKSDNGITYEGIPEEQRQHLYNGKLSGKKGKLLEGGLRVPGLLEWPSVIDQPLATDYPAVTSDIMPTLLDLLGLSHPDPQRPLDGISLKPLIMGEKVADRPQPIGSWVYDFKGEEQHPQWIADPELNRMITMTTRQKKGNLPKSRFYFKNHRHPQVKENPAGSAVWIDNAFKLSVSRRGPKQKIELYHLNSDPQETNNVASSNPERAQQMLEDLNRWRMSVEHSLTGADYE